MDTVEKPLRILGLDPAITNTGYCVLDVVEEGSPHACLKWRDYGVIRSKETEKPDHIRFAEIITRIKDLWRRYAFDLVCCEAPLPWAKNPGSLRVIPLYVQLCQIFSRWHPFADPSLTLPRFFCAFLPRRLNSLIYEGQPKSKGKSSQTKDKESVRFLKQLRPELQTYVFSDHTADAYFAGFFGWRYYQYLENSLPQPSAKEFQFFESLRGEEASWWRNT